MPANLRIIWTRHSKGRNSGGWCQVFILGTHSGCDNSKLDLQSIATSLQPRQRQSHQRQDAYETDKDEEAVSSPFVLSPASTLSWDSDTMRTECDRTLERPRHSLNPFRYAPITQFEISRRPGQICRRSPTPPPPPPRSPTQPPNVVVQMGALKFQEKRKNIC